MRYIDAGGLKDTIQNNDYVLSDRINSTDRGMFTTGIFEAIDAQPTADVRENVKGEWLHKKTTDDYHVTGQCSNCHERRRIDNFCPNCGADMRGKL